VEPGLSYQARTDDVANERSDAFKGRHQGLLAHDRLAAANCRTHDLGVHRRRTGYQHGVDIGVREGGLEPSVEFVEASIAIGRLARLL
jgi:hypothetical protein